MRYSRHRMHSRCGRSLTYLGKIVIFMIFSGRASSASGAMGHNVAGTIPVWMKSKASRDKPVSRRLRAEARRCRVKVSLPASPGAMTNVDGPAMRPLSSARTGALHAGPPRRRGSASNSRRSRSPPAGIARDWRSSSSSRHARRNWRTRDKPARSPGRRRARASAARAANPRRIVRIVVSFGDRSNFCSAHQWPMSSAPSLIELRCGRSRSFTTPFMILRVGRRRPTEVFFSADARDPVRTEAP